MCRRVHCEGECIDADEGREMNAQRSGLGLFGTSTIHRTSPFLALGRRVLDCGPLAPFFPTDSPGQGCIGASRPHGGWTWKGRTISEFFLKKKQFRGNGGLIAVVCGEEGGAGGGTAVLSAGVAMSVPLLTIAVSTPPPPPPLAPPPTDGGAEPKNSEKGILKRRVEDVRPNESGSHYRQGTGRLLYDAGTNRPLWNAPAPSVAQGSRGVEHGPPALGVWS